MNVSILVGDCRQTLRKLPDQSVSCVVTSPPYFGLRDYGVEGQLGLEPSPEEFIENLVSVFREVWRVLRDDGTLWLNLGDSFAGGGCGSRDAERWPKQSRNDHMPVHAKKLTGLKPKNLIGIPWRVALALQADGWYLRQDIIWHKPNAMPESVRDRVTKCHEYIFLLSKAPTYFFNPDAIRETVKSKNGNSRSFRGGGIYTGGHSFNNHFQKTRETTGNTENTSGYRNARSVWTISTKPFKGAHFATFPPDLVKPCILAGCPRGGTVLDPFGGSGTTALVARELGRNTILCELNADYAELARVRLGGDLMVQVEEAA